MEANLAHILFIDDNPSLIQEVKGWLTDIFGYLKLETAGSTSEALQKLQTPFDVIVADMRMEENDSGFTILEYVQDKSLSAVVIIFTANDTVEDCRRAFREKAWDYIPKDIEGNAFEVLHQSIQEAIAYLNRWGNQRNEQWLKENKATLEQEYWGKYVAILNQDVIESADTEAELTQQLIERQLRRLTATVYKIGDLKPIANLLELEESSTLEFKRNLQLTSDQERDKSHLNVMKAIAAFLNSDGGTLLIGVANDRKIYGLKEDYQFFKKPSRDQLELHLISLIGSKIGKLFLPHIKIRFEEVDGKDICAVYVRKSDRVAFVSHRKELLLYIRTGNSSRPIPFPEIYNHL